MADPILLPSWQRSPAEGMPDPASDMPTILQRRVSHEPAVMQTVTGLHQ